MDRRAARAYEFSIAMVVVGLLSVVLLNRLDASQARVEDAAMQLEVATLRSELLDGQAHREVFGGALPASRNPVDWTGHAPASYLGALDTVPARNGVWYFDTRGEVLVYRYRSGREARFRLVRGEKGGKSGEERGAEGSEAPGILGGIGLRRLADTASAGNP